MRTLLLSKNDVEELLSMENVIECVEKAYIAYNNGAVIQPDIMSIEIPEHNGEIDFKAAYVKDTDYISMKSASGFFDNHKTTSLPNSLSSLQLFDGSTGFPVCIMDASLITGYRTAAAGAISAKYLARPDSKEVAIIGAGMQARTQLEAVCQVLPITQTSVWSIDIDEAKRYSEDMEAVLRIPIDVCDTVEDAVKTADIIITVTPSKTPLVKRDWIQNGTHITAVGADMSGKQELESSVFKDAKVVTDSTPQCISRGETENAIINGDIDESDIYCEIGEIVSGEKKGRQFKEEITIFDTTGMAIQDNYTAKLLYNLAVERNMGMNFEFI